MPDEPHTTACTDRDGCVSGSSQCDRILIGRFRIRSVSSRDVTTGDGYTLEGILMVGLIMGGVFVCAVLLGLLGRGIDHLAGYIPSVRTRREREAESRAQRWEEHRRAKENLEWSRAQLVRSWNDRDLPDSERRREYEEWKAEHPDENNPWSYYDLYEWEERFGPESPPG